MQHRLAHRRARAHGRAGTRGPERTTFGESCPATSTARCPPCSGSRGVLVALAAAVVLAVAGTTCGYAALSKHRDPVPRRAGAGGHRDRRHRRRRPRGRGHRGRRARRRRARASTRPVDDGSRISVRFGRPLELERRRRDADPLGHLDRRRPRARRDRPALRRRRPVHQPWRRHRPRRHGARGRHPEEADGHDRRQEAGHARRSPRSPSRTRSSELGVKVEQARHRQARRRRPRSRTATRSSSPTSASSPSRSTREAIDFDTVEREDASMFEGETEVVRSGAAGVRDVTYRLVFRNGELVDHKVLRQDVLARAGRRDRPGRHQGAPAAANFAGGSTVWDPLAAVRVRRQLGHQHRQRLLRRPAVQPGHLAGATAARAARTSRAARPRSRSPRRSAPRPVATAPGRAARSRSACPSERS